MSDPTYKVGDHVTFGTFESRGAGDDSGTIVALYTNNADPDDKIAAIEFDGIDYNDPMNDTDVAYFTPVSAISGYAD